jgi:hypothetical protein
MKMRVGVNYPWFDYGWDFGPGPVEWRGVQSVPRWHDEIDQHLERFRALGITVVRWFILADGLTYGYGLDAPQIDPAAPTGWRFDPPLLSPDALTHFDELLQRFSVSGRGASRGLQLLPVLIDFHFCRPGVTVIGPDTSWVKGGRADVITDEDSRQRFLDNALEPLLQVSQQHPEVIYAWEVINEPDWVTRGWQRSMLTATPFDASSMTAFLEAATARIRRAGFASTIGFASAEGLDRSGISCDINQFHHYPRGERRLRRYTVDSVVPCIIGEFATAPTEAWPELSPSEQTVLNRLKVASALGYPLALPWSFLAEDRHTLWSPAVERDIEMFATEQTEE